MDMQTVTDAFKTLRAEIGRDAYLSASLNTDPWEDKSAIFASIYPEGLLVNDTAFRVYADTWEDLVANTRLRWEERRGSMHRKVTRDMALAIILITADMGECTDAALIAAGFASDKVKALAAIAAEEATSLADNGPFTVVMGKSNEV